jgi:hypothetical protein
MSDRRNMRTRDGLDVRVHEERDGSNQTVVYTDSWLGLLRGWPFLQRRRHTDVPILL